MNTTPDATMTNSLATINSLLIAATGANKQQALEFIITNETHKLIYYDRAILCRVENKKISIINISGEPSILPLTEFYRKLTNLLNSFVNPNFIQSLSAEKFTRNQEVWAEYQRQNKSSAIWLPIHSNGELILGLMLEKWDVSPNFEFSPEIISSMSKYLLPGYGVAWSRFKKFKGKPHKRNKYKALALLAIPLLLPLLFLFHLPLRIVAPCEVIIKDPTVVTAPLQGVIENILVKPGEHVDKGAILFKYDQRLFEQELKIARNEYLVGEAALNRALALGLHDETSLNEVAILKLKLQKQKIDYELAKSNYEKVNVAAITAGRVIIDKVDEWVGKPVQIGEKIITIADLSQTKIKIWIPESDNIKINPDSDIEIILNVNPEIIRKARISYISNEVVLSDKNIPSFQAEAEWVDQKTEVKAGLRGTAVLYGEKVSLFYYLIRKPWIMLRKISSL